MESKNSLLVMAFPVVFGAFLIGGPVSAATIFGSDTPPRFRARPDWIERIRYRGH